MNANVVHFATWVQSARCSGTRASGRRLGAQEAILVVFVAKQHRKTRFIVADGDGVLLVTRLAVEALPGFERLSIFTEETNGVATIVELHAEQQAAFTRVQSVRAGRVGKAHGVTE